MNKKIYLTIIWIITLFAIIAGVVWHFRINGAKSGGDSTISSTMDFSDQEISNLDIDSDISNVSISNGDKCSVYYECPENLVPDISIDGDTLVVTGPKTSRFSFGDADSHYYMEITIPQNVTLSDIDIEADYGNIELKDISCDSLSIEADAGGIDADSIKASEVKISADLGGVEFDNSNFDYIEIEADAGNISLDNCDFVSGHITADAGNINVNGEFEELGAYCDLGNITVNTESDPDNIELDLKSDIGNVQVNGSKW